MAQANSGDTVRINYTGKLTDGTVFDSSEGRDPLEFVIGGNTIIPTLEAACVGMTIGDKATVDVTADNAYGPHQPDVATAVHQLVALLGDFGAERNRGLSKLGVEPGTRSTEHHDACHVSHARRYA